MLEPAVRQRLHDQLQKLNVEGKLLSRVQLEQFYSTFRNRFGPDRLASLDGETLLECMHALVSKDSLVYWLEYKNDDEFPARFGSIAGGTSLKYGIFKRKETGAWTTAGEGNYPKEITVDEAVAIARRHRDQLVRGVELIRQLLEEPTDANYARLQQQLDREVPDVSDLAWGHKYFCLICPDKLDLYHNPDWQRFHLLKMLQLPPEESGRYACAGRFVAAAAELAVPMHNFYEALSAVNGRKHRYWRVGTSDGSAPRNRWQLMREGSCVAIGWPKLGNLSALEMDTEFSAAQPTKDTREHLKEQLAEHYPNTPATNGRFCTQIINFVKVITPGDYVLACDGVTVLGVGRVVGDYGFEADSDFAHRRPVEWLSLEEWKMPEPEGLQTSVAPLKKSLLNLLETERKVQGSSAPPPRPTPRPETPSKTQPTLTGIPGRVQSILERKGQVLLYGPPGTGKTFWAERSAFDLAAYGAFGRMFSELTADEKTTVLGDGADGLVRFCCFHPGYGYEDFIEGYRPETVGGQITFRLRDGVFKRLCKDARVATNRRFYLIVDEINRGDIPRIFGELLTVLEKDKRTKSVILPVSGESFHVPPNVFLIGTMNTADRSISLLDAALRRRFGFVELMPDPALLRGQTVSGVPLGPWLAALNNRICAHLGRDARNLQVGHSYLLEAERPAKDMASFKRVLRDDLLPLLEEYCYEDFDALQKILGHGFVDTSARRLRFEVFEDGQEELLIQALKEPCPEVFSSSETNAPSEETEEEVEDEGVGDGEES
jgi:5-methylcytosine-specific restriction protein B